MRLIPGSILVLAGLGLGVWVRWWIGLIAGLLGAFMVFEAVRSWCIVRASGFHTRF